MGLLEHRSEGIHVVRWVRADAIAVDQREIAVSFLLAPDRIDAAWPPRTLEEIDAGAVDAVLAMQPGLVLLGTGLVQRLPAPKLMAAFLQRGIGLEAMDNPAAARTFNLLAAEGRRVVAAFLLPG
jgi:uncharacterized protein